MDAQHLVDQLLERYGGSDKERGFWFHGTSMKRLPSIKAEGLVPHPKKRSWAEDPDTSSHRPSRASYGGIYVTQNFMTAYSAGGRTARADKMNTLMVEMEIQPRSLVADEDNFSMTLSQIKGHLSGHISSALWRYKALNNPDDAEYAEADRREWVQSNVTYIMARMERDIHPALRERLESLLYEQGWPAMLTRLVSHNTDKWDWPRLWPREMQDTGTVPALPSPQEGEEVFRQFIDQLTRTLKHVTRTKQRATHGRLLTPVGFSGSNRITALVEMAHRYDVEPSVYKLRIHYGKPSAEFLAKYRESITDRAEVEDLTAK